MKLVVVVCVCVVVIVSMYETTQVACDSVYNSCICMKSHKSHVIQCTTVVFSSECDIPQ